MHFSFSLNANYSTTMCLDVSHSGLIFQNMPCIFAVCTFELTFISEDFLQWLFFSICSFQLLWFSALEIYIHTPTHTHAQFANVLGYLLLNLFFFFFGCAIQLSSPARPSAVKVRTPNHWMAREFPLVLFK